MFLLASLATAALDPSSTAIVGNVRVQALSATVLRIEPKGPMGFFNTTSFVVVNRSSFAGIPITSSATVQNKDGSTSTSTLKTAAYTISITQAGGSAPPPTPAGDMCTSPQVGTDVSTSKRVDGCRQRRES